jgi:RimJ/RimL family protein N-acetyltransferase
MDNIKILETERLILRNYQKEDLQDYWEFASSPEVGPRAGWPAHTDINETKERLEEVEMNKEYQFAIVLKEENKVLGSIEIMDIKETRFDGLNIPEGSKEIGYVLNDKYWGRGIMTEALNEITRFVFEDLNAPAIAICHAKANVGSGKVQDKCGFKIVGVRLNYRTWIDGTVTSLIQRVMTKDEYFSMKKTR